MLAYILSDSSFFNLIKAAKSGNYQFNQISLPRYLKKESYFSLIIPRIKVKNGFFKIPMFRDFEAKYGKVKILFPERLLDNILKEILTHPKYNCQFCEVEFITEEKLIIVYCSVFYRVFLIISFFFLTITNRLL